jgi:hypothetical protein
MPNRKLILMVAALIPFGISSIAVAQTGNPLRYGNQVLVENPDPQNSRTGLAEGNMPPEVYRAIYKPDSHQSTQPRAEQPILDRQVSPATHIAEPKNDLGPLNVLLDSLPNRLPKMDQADRPLGAMLPDQSKPVNRSAESLPISKQFDSERFQKLLKQLGINTGIVMCVGIGFILIAKQWVKGKRPKTRTANATIQIKSTLKLSPKSSLFLVQTGEHRLIVASDQNGIKSVVRLTDSFTNTLDSISDIAGEVENEASGSDRDPGSRDNAELYSLATVGNSDAQRKTNSKNGRSEEDVRRLMEKALNDHGLKDLFLKTMESRS